MEIWEREGEVYVVECTENREFVVIGAYGPLDREPWPLEVEGLKVSPWLWNVDIKESLQLEWNREAFSRKKVVH